ncbi:heparanase [Elgaria multicarinata webbii]|uniref:heparanase n=1 Tax=Elgaria multicarinata webbii TaxID=159646 RepID=UPI002FCCE56A
MQLLPLLFSWALLPRSNLAELAAQADGAMLSFQRLPNQPVLEVSPFFLSITIDANLATDPRYITFLGSKKLCTLARGLSPGFLRFGGTKTDFMIFDPEKEPTWEEKVLQVLLAKQGANGISEFASAPSDILEHLQSLWPSQERLILKEEDKPVRKNATITPSTVDILYSFARCADLDLIFGLNALLRKGDGQWDSANAQLVLNYTDSQNYSMSWELGNEPNSFLHKSGIWVEGSQLGQDFIQLRRLLDNYTRYRNSKLYGPDIGQPRKKHKHIPKMLRSFLKSGGKVIDSVTWHHYYLNGKTATKEDFLSPDVLDTFISIVKEELKIVNETVPGKKVWLGETSSAYGGGAPHMSNTYIAGFMWLDKLGQSALLGIDVVMRQVLFGAGSYHLVDARFDPLPDYWLSLVYKKLVGNRVLHVNLTGEDPRKLRVYLHCTNEYHPKYRDGDLTLFALNLCNSTKHLHLPVSLSKKQIDEYLLLPEGKDSILSTSVRLNGHVLKMLDDETLPTLREKLLRPGSTLELPAFSYGFYVIRNAKERACI